MAQKSILEHTAKRLLANYMLKTPIKKINPNIHVCRINEKTKLDYLENNISWLKTKNLVVKPDCLIGKRSKNNLILVNSTWEEAKQFIKERMGKRITIGNTTGKLSGFIVEPYIEHDIGDEMYLSISTGREYDTLLFSFSGGVDIEDKQDDIIEITIPIINDFNIKSALFSALNPKRDFSQAQPLIDYIAFLYQFFVELDFSFLEINPLVLTPNGFYNLDMKAKLDDTALFQQKQTWGDIHFPHEFGSQTFPEEQKIQELNNNTGASLKLSILNPNGNIWQLIAGGGASVIYTDTINELGYSDQLANYGEYSGNPSSNDMYEYTSTILNLMVANPTPEGESKYLLIGGGVANFTDIAETFLGITKALIFFHQKLIAANVEILVRRGGPNYQAALEDMAKLGKELGIPITIYGPETHMTRIIREGLES